MIIIGEKINGSIPAVAEAIAKRDADFIKARAAAQAKAGAAYIDCCASVPEAEEVETLHWMIDCIQEVTDLPISADSPSPDVLAQAYQFCKRPGIFNSVSGEGDKIDKIFPIMAQPENKGWQAIALLCISSLLSTTLPEMEQVVRALRRNDPKRRYRIMVGGGAVTRQAAEHMGADAYTENCVEAAEVAKTFIV